MKTSVKTTMTRVRTTRYAILPERLFSCALEISVLVVLVCWRRRADLAWPHQKP